MTFDLDPLEGDRQFWDTFYLAANLAGYKVICVENVELCKDSRDKLALDSMLSNRPPVGLKVVIEQGTLQSTTVPLKWPANTKSSTIELEVSAFNPVEASELYRFVHEQTPPVRLQEKTQGNALCIVHYSNDTPNTPDLQWVEAALGKLKTPERLLLHTISILGQPCSLNELQEAYPIEYDCLAAVESLLFNRILRETDRGLAFAHPSFQLYFNRWATSSVHDELKRKILLRLKDKANTFEERLRCSMLAAQISDNFTLSYFGPTVLGEAIERQLYKTVIDLSGKLTKIASSDNSIGVLQIARIQSLVQIGDVESARLCFNALEARDLDVGNQIATKMRLLSGSILYGESRFEKSQLVALEMTESEDIETAASAWGLLASNLIALGEINKARDAYTMQRNNLESLQDPRLALDCGRIAARILPSVLAQEVLQDILSNTAEDRFLVSRAKLLHNLGMIELLDGYAGSEDRLNQARDIFEELGLGLASHSMIALGLASVFEGNYERADLAFRDALNICFEGLDRYAAYANLTLTASLQNDLDSANRHSKSALSIATERGLNEDKLALNGARLNRTLVLTNLGRFEEAKKIAMKVDRSGLSRWPDAYRERTNRIISACNAKRNLYASAETNSADRDWYVSRFNLVPMGLSFYGVRSDVVTPQIISQHV